MKRTEKESGLINFLKASLIGLVAFIPFVYSPNYFFPFFSAKTAVFQGSIIILLFLFLYAIHLGKARLPKLDMVGASFLFFIGCMFISSIFGLDFGHSFWSAFERGTGLLFYASLFVFFILLKSVFKTERDWAKLYFGIAISMTVIAVFTFFDQSIGNFFGGGFTLGNSSFVGASLLFPMFVSFIALPKIFGKKKGYIVAGIIFLISVLCPIFINTPGIFSGTIDGVMSLAGEARGAALGLFFGVISSAILYASFSSKKAIKMSGIILGVILFSVVLVGTLKLVTPGSAINQKFSDAAWPNRFIYWDIGIQGFKENPVFGQGHEMFVAEFTKNFDPIILTPKYLNEYFVDRPHNAYIEIIYNFGIVGALAFAFLIFSLFYSINSARRNFRVNNLEASVLYGLIISYLIQNIFIFDTMIPLILFVVTFGFISFISRDEKENEKNGKFYQLMEHPFSPIVFGAILITAFIFFAYLPAFKSKSYVKIATAKDPMERMSLYDNGQIISIGDSTDNPVIAEMVFNQISKFTSSSVNMTAEDRAVVVADLKGAIEFAERGAERFPYYQRTFTVLASLNNLAAYFSPQQDRGAFIVEAEKWGNKAVEVSPNNPQGLWVLAQVYEIVTEWELSYEMLDKAIDIAPYQKTSYMRGMIVAMEDGNKSKYDEYRDLLLATFPQLTEKDYPAWGSVQKVQRIVK
jgi:O-antigen ligase